MRVRLLAALTAGVTAGLLTMLCCQLQENLIDPTPWVTPAKCCEDLAQLGYEVHLLESGIGFPDTYLLRRTDCHETVVELRGKVLSASQFARGTGYLFVGFAPVDSEVGSDPTFLQVRRVVLRGHPEELNRVRARIK